MEELLTEEYEFIIQDRMQESALIKDFTATHKPYLVCEDVRYETNYGKPSIRFHVIDRFRDLFESHDFYKETFYTDNQHEEEFEQEQ